MFMSLLRFVYVALPCTDPDWDGTVMEQTRLYLVVNLGVNISSVRVPSLLFWWRHTKIILFYLAIMLCYDGQLRNGSVATHFILFSSNATSSATGGNVVVPERPTRNEEPISRIEVQTCHLVLPQNLLNELVCILPVLEHEMLSYLTHFFF